MKTLRKTPGDSLTETLGDSSSSTSTSTLHLTTSASTKSTFTSEMTPWGVAP